jgi:hypothetical protein
VRHHDIDGGEIRNVIFCNGHAVRSALVGRVKPVLIAPVGEGPVAEFRLVGGGVDLAIIS